MMLTGVPVSSRKRSLLAPSGPVKTTSMRISRFLGSKAWANMSEIPEYRADHFAGPIEAVIAQALRHPARLFLVWAVTVNDAGRGHAIDPIAIDEDDPFVRVAPPDLFTREFFARVCRFRRVRHWSTINGRAAAGNFSAVGFARLAQEGAVRQQVDRDRLAAGAGGEAGATREVRLAIVRLPHRQRARQLEQRIHRASDHVRAVRGFRHSPTISLIAIQRKSSKPSRAPRARYSANGSWKPPSPVAVAPSLLRSGTRIAFNPTCPSIDNR